LKLATLLFSVVFCISCSTNKKEESINPQAGIYISMTNLLVFGNKFENKHIRVLGYLGISGDHLFLTKDHSEALDFSSAIPLYLNKNENNFMEFQDCYSKYGSVSGEVQRNIDGNLVLGNITRIFIPDTGDCYLKTPSSTE